MLRKTLGDCETCEYALKCDRYSGITGSPLKALYGCPQHIKDIVAIENEYDDIVNIIESNGYHPIAIDDTIMLHKDDLVYTFKFKDGVWDVFVRKVLNLSARKYSTAELKEKLKEIL